MAESDSRSVLKEGVGLIALQHSGALNFKATASAQKGFRLEILSYGLV